MASPTRPTVAHRIVRADRTTRGDRRSGRLRLEQRNSRAIASQLRRRTEDSLPERESLPRLSRSRQTQPLLQARTTQRSGSGRQRRIHWTRSRCAKRPPLWSGSTTATPESHSSRGASITATPCTRSSISLDRRTWFRPCSLRAIRTVEVRRCSIRAGNGWPRHTRTEVAFWPLAGPWGRVFELSQPARIVEFVGDGSRVLTLNLDNSLLDRPLQGGTVRQVRPATGTRPLIYMSRDSAGRRVALSGAAGQIEVVDLATGSAQSMPGVPSAMSWGSRRSQRTAACWRSACAAAVRTRFGSTCGISRLEKRRPSVRSWRAARRPWASPRFNSSETTRSMRR